MRVERVRAASFRCYDRLDVEFAPALTAVVGRNGAGKTSLVEAVHFGCMGYSPRTTQEARCVRAGAELLRVEVDGTAVGVPLRTAVGFRPGEPKRITVDGAPVRSVDRLGERWACLVFTPDHLALVKRAPAVRRAYLDRALGRLVPGYARTAADYGRALAQRGALLRRIRAGGVAPAALDPWDAQLASTGTELVRCRRTVVTRLAPRFRDRVGLLGGAREDAVLDYVTASPDTPEALLEALRSRRARDVERAVTGIGPHLDDVSLSERAREVRDFGSQGEQRTAVLALLLAEADLLAEARGAPPILLLDDVLSELDEERRTRLLDAVRAHGQTVLTTADPRDLPVAPDRLLTVEDGRVDVAGAGR